MNLVSENLSPALIDGGSLVPFRRRLVAASLQVVLHPVVSGRTPDEIEFILVQIKENRIANHVSIMIAGDKLLGLIDLEILEAIDTQIGEQFERIGTLDIEIGHVVGLVEKSAGFPPGTLFVSPVGELGTHHRKGIWSYLRIAQQFNWTPDGL